MKLIVRRKPSTITLIRTFYCKKYCLTKKQKIQRNNRTSTHRINRSYDDFINYIANNPSANMIKMHSVHGRKVKKVLLTLLFRNSLLMIVIPLENFTQRAVKESLNKICESILLLSTSFISKAHV